MKPPTIKDLINALAFAVCIGVVAWGCWELSDRAEACAQRGGALVRAVVGFECVRKETLP